MICNGIVAVIRQVCGIVGAFATITSSIFLPITFYHTLYGKYNDIPFGRTCMHVGIAVFASVAMFVGVTSSICAIVHGENALCKMTVPSS